MGADRNKENSIFFNHSFDKKRLKALISWVFKQSGEAEALKVVDLLKETGFRHATKAGISIGLHDLTTPIQKSWLISESQLAMNTTERDFIGARITATERSQRIVDTWHRASESLSKQVVDYFGIYDKFNPVYIMALSGARGNFSQVRQLIGMRGLMADQQGKIVNFPIRSNLREGLTLTEYFISCSGARKGLVDTALRTADTGYLTRRLVDVSHHVVVKRIRCNTNRGIAFKSLQSYNKILLALKERLVGRVLAEDVFLKNEDNISKECNAVQETKNRRYHPFENSYRILAKKDQEISLKLALKIVKIRDKVYLRSPLTCGFTHTVCQLCYGWSISQGSLVSLGDAVGVIAAQSIGEPGTQLTMRTFHTGGVFSGDLLQEIRAPHAGEIEFSKAFQGLLIRTAHGRIAFLSKTQGSLILKHTSVKNSFTTIPIPAFTMLFVRQGEKVENNQLLAEYSIRTKEGNQPIKTQQTIFAQLSGRVVEDCSGKVYTKSIKESALLLDTLEGDASPSYTGRKSGNRCKPLCKSSCTCKTICQQSLINSCQSKADLVALKQKNGVIPLLASQKKSSKSSWTYKVKPFTPSFPGAKPYVTQAISSFSSYNGYVCSQKLNDHNQFLLPGLAKQEPKRSLFETPPTEEMPDCLLAKKLDTKKREPCKPFSIYGKKWAVFSEKKHPYSKKQKITFPCFFLKQVKKQAKASNKSSFRPNSFYGVLYFAKKQKAIGGKVVPSFWACNNSCLKLLFCKTLRNTNPIKLNRSARTKKLKTQPFYLQSNEPSRPCRQNCLRLRATIGGLNLLHDVKDKVLQTIFDSRFGVASISGKRFVFLNEAKKKQFSCKSCLLRPSPFVRRATEREGRRGLRASACKSMICRRSFANKAELCKPSPFARRRSKAELCTCNQDPQSRFAKRFARKASQSGENDCKMKSVKTKAQIFFSQKSEDLESDTFQYIEPVRSGRLGFLKILSTRVGATLNFMSPLKPFDQSVKKRKSLSAKTFTGVRLGFKELKKESVFFSSLSNKYLHPEFVRENRFFLQTIAEHGDIVEEDYSYNHFSSNKGK